MDLLTFPASEIREKEGFHILVLLLRPQDQCLTNRVYPTTIYQRNAREEFEAKRAQDQAEFEAKRAQDKAEADAKLAQKLDDQNVKFEKTRIQDKAETDGDFI